MTNLTTASIRNLKNFPPPVDVLDREALDSGGDGGEKYGGTR
jgi:hypothetical protein